MKEVFISWEQYDTDLRKIVNEIKKELSFVRIYALPRGGLVAAVHMSHLLNIPLTNDSGNTSGTLFVDDVSDTGKTLLSIGCMNQNTACLYRKAGTSFEPRFVARTIEGWIHFPWER